MLNKIQILPTRFSKRVTSASTMVGNASPWQNATEAIEGCGQLQRLILEYGKHFPHPILSPPCDKPESPCLHFCYCDSIRPSSSVSNNTCHDIDIDSESDREIVDEMTLTFPRKGDVIDYISELKLNTRRSTPLHWLEPEDKLAIHDITSKFKKAFQDSRTTPSLSRPYSAAPNLGGTKQGNEEEEDIDETGVKIRIPKRIIRPTSVRPAPRLTVTPCAKCARRQLSAAKIATRQKFDSPVMMNIVEAYVGPSPNESDKRTMFFLDTHTSRAIDLAPPPSPTVDSEEKEKIRSRHSGKLEYTGFVSSAFSKKFRRERAKTARINRRRLSPSVQVTLADMKSSSADDIFKLEDEDEEDTMSLDGVIQSFFPANRKVPSLSHLTDFTQSDTEGDPRIATASPRLTISTVNPNLKRLRPIEPRPIAQSPQWVEDAFLVKSPSRSPSTERKFSGTKPGEDQEQGHLRTIIPTSLLKRPTTSSSQPTSHSKTKQSPHSATTTQSKAKGRHEAASAPIPQLEKKLPPSSPIAASRSETKVPPITSSPTMLSEGNKVSSSVTILPAITFPLEAPASLLSAKTSQSDPVKSSSTKRIMSGSSKRSSSSAKSRRSTTKTSDSSSKKKTPTSAETKDGSGQMAGEGLANKSLHPVPPLGQLTGNTGEADSNNADDMPNTGEVAKLKNQLTNAAEPMAALGLSARRDGEIMSPNSGRISPPLVHPADVETAVFRTLNEIEATNKQGFGNNANSAPARKMLKSDDPEVRKRMELAKKLRPPPLPRKKKDEPEPVKEPVEEPSAPIETKGTPPVCEDEDEGGDGNDFTLEEPPVEDVEEPAEEPPESPSEPEEEEQDEGDIEIDEENEKWWIYTSTAAQLALEIDQLRGRILCRLPRPPSPPRNSSPRNPRSPIRRRRGGLSRSVTIVKDPKREFVEQMSEKARHQLAGKEQERYDFLSRLRMIRTDVRDERNEFKKTTRETAKRIALIRRELEFVRRQEQILSARYFAKRDRDRFEREIQRRKKEVQLKAEAETDYEEPNEKEVKVDAFRDDAMLLFDEETRDTELNRLDNLSIEYEEQKRIDLERKWHEIEVTLEFEEEECRRMDAVEEDLLLGDIRYQAQSLLDQIETEESILQANKLVSDTKVASIQYREDEVIDKRVETESSVVDELTVLRDNLLNMLKAEEDAERAAREAKEDEKLHRLQLAIALRNQHTELVNEMAISPAFVYSYFRFAERQFDEEGSALKLKLKSVGNRRPNTPFKPAK